MNLKEKYNLIYKIKSSKDIRYKKLAEQQTNLLLNELLKTRRIYSVEDILNTKRLIISGVYLIYFKDKNNKIKFTYIGESADIFKRWKQHIKLLKSNVKLYSKIRKKTLNFEEIKFVLLEEIEEQNQRLKKETYYIYCFKNKFISLNTKLLSKKVRCDFGHGNCRSYISYKEKNNDIQLYVYGICKNKYCKNKFLIS